ncbi:MAG: hypothetical protein ACKO9V_10075 [Candidatus Kapaibacterium sp.]
MRILVQRYLDGDLNDVERAAFLDDVAHDTQLAEVLENETRLDMAFVDDAFTIEPPPYLRSAVLDAVAADSAVRPHTALRSAAGLITAGLLFLAVSVNAPEAVVEDVHPQRASRGVTTGLPARESLAAESRTSTGETRTVPGIALSVDVSVDNGVPSAQDNDEHVGRGADALSSSMVERPTMMTVTSVSPVVAAANVGLGIGNRMLPEADGSSPVVIQPFGHRFGTVGAASGASVRYHLSARDGFFIESGWTAARMRTALFVNGVERRTEQTRDVPYALVGYEGSLGSVPALGREFNVAVALGVTALGPVAVIDASMHIVSVGTMSVDAGVRVLGTADLRQHTSILSPPLPFMRMTLGL